MREVIVVGIVLNKNGEVLIIKRKKPEITETGKQFVWAFPGGKVEHNETREERIEKEILVETGYKVKAIRELDLRIHPDSFVIISYFLCELENDKPIQKIEEVDEVDEVKWVKPDELKNYFTTDIDPEVKKLLKID